MEEWKEYNLGEVADIQTGPFGSQLHNKDYVLIGVPIVTVEHLGERKFTTQNLPKVSDADKIRLNKYTLKEGDIVYSRVGSVDRCSYVSSKEAGWLFSGRCLRVRCNEEITPLFMYYFLQQTNIKQTIRNIAVGATMPSINTTLLSGLKVSIPSRSSQFKIASVLSSLDDKIECNRRINENLEQQAQTLFKSWLSNCQEEVTIGDLSINVTDYSKCSYDEVVLVNSSDVTEGRFEHQNLSENKNLKGHFKKRFKKGDILYSQVRPRNRHWAYCTFDADNYLASTQLMVIRNKTSVIPSILLYQYIIGDDVWMEFTNKTETRSGTFPQGNYEEISAIKVKFGAEMNIITPSLEHIYSMIYNNDQESRRLVELRDTLLPKLMSGEISVSDIK